MGTSAIVTLLLKNGMEYNIRTAFDGFYSYCGKALWEWLRSLTSEQWDMLNERLEKMTWVNEHEARSTCKKCTFICPREPKRHTMYDVLRDDYHKLAELLCSVMNDKTPSMINSDFEWDCDDYYYQIDFKSMNFSVHDGGEYVEMPFQSKIARIVFGSSVQIGEGGSE